MKRIIFTLAFVFIFTAGAFAQTTADEWFQKAADYYDKGDYANAVTAYSESIKRGSTNPNAYFMRGVAYYQIKNYDAAIADCDTVIKGAPNFSTVYMIRGDAYGAKGVYHKAIADFKTGLEKGEDPGGFNVDKSSNADMWFCGAMYMEIVINRFLGKSDVVTKYENWLKTVCDKNKVTRAEIEKFYRDNVRSLIAAVVDGEFNKVSFPLRNLSADRTYDTVLTRNPQNGQYILNYERPDRRQDGIKTLTATLLDALLDEMRNGKNKNDFTPADLDTVRAQAALIPAVALNNVALDDVKTILTAFYTTPNATTYNAVRDIYVLYDRMLIQTKKPIFERTRISYLDTLSVLNDNLATKVIKDVSSGGTYTITSDQQQRLVGLR